MLETRLRSFGDATGGGTSQVYAASGAFFITYAADTSLSSEKVLTASNNITLTTDANTIYVSANTGVSVVYAATGNKYAVLDLASDLTNEFRLVQSGNSITIDTTGNLIIINAATGNLSGKQDSITFPLITGSGGTGRSTVGSAHTVLGVNSDGSTLTYYAILASDNATVIKSGTGIFISALTSPVAAGGGVGTVNPGSAGNLAYYVSAGTAVDDLLIGSAHTILGVNSSGASHTYYHILASNNAVVTKVGTAVFITANTVSIAGKQDSIAIPLIIGSGGTGRTTAGSAHTLLGVNSDGTTLSYYAILASNNATVTKVGTSVFISANTAVDIVYAATGNSYVVIGLAGDLTAERVLAASTGLTLTDGGAAGNASFSINTNVRDKIFTFFAPLALSTTMAAEEIRFRVPFACQPIRCDLAVTNTPLVSGITCDLLQFSNPAAAAGSTIFSTSGNKPQIGANSSTGNTTTFDTTVLHAGSYLGMRILQVGSATAQGSNLTLTFVVRTS